MNAQIHRIQVVVAYDFSVNAEHALARALDVACRAPQHIVHLVAALDPRLGLPILETRHADYAYADKIQALAAEHVRIALAGRPSSGPVEFFVHARFGHPAEQILEVAEDVGADLVFIGSHGFVGMERMLLGSVSERVVREARCPVMVVRPKEYRDVELLHVVDDNREHKPYKPPLRFSYADRSAITRPNDWPIS